MTTLIKEFTENKNKIQFRIRKEEENSNCINRSTMYIFISIITGVVSKISVPLSPKPTPSNLFHVIFLYSLSIFSAHTSTSAK